MMDINLEAGHIVEITTAPSTPPKKLSVPILGLEKFPSQQEIEGQDVRNRRPVRPIDRQRMRPWLMELLDLGNVFGLHWTNRSQGIFQISWRHASRLGWNLETDGDVFERWARHTGIYKEGDPPEPKRWKANFRCALHSLHDVMELTNAVERRGRNACRTYQFLQNNTTSNPKAARTREKRPKPIEPKESRELVRVLTYERPIRQPVQIQLQESGSSDELLSETESEGSHQDKVIVQRLDPKSGEIGEEEFLLHDHDYSGHQEKTQRTIYLRQGVGSIVLHKEVLNAPQLMEDAKAAEALANLEQLASAAVDSQDLAEGTIMIDANMLSEGSNKGSPTKASNMSEENSTLSLKTLLPRLRARIKESERGGGFVKKRKYLEADAADLEEKRILGHNQYRLKKAKSDAGVSPPSPQNTKRRSGSPKKQTKTNTKTKRSRKESEGSASDSTEPLMSSCLLLLEAATRLDNAEKGEGLSNKKSSKHDRKGGDATIVRGKRKKGVWAAVKEEEVDEGDVIGEQQEVIEECVVGDDMGELVVEGNEETVIEEKIIYPENFMQIVYDDVVEDEPGHVMKTEVVEEEGEEPAVYDILRTALENIGSEMEVSTSNETSSPKEMAIMRRKKDSERAPVYNALTVCGGKIMVTEASFAKGLFSGSEIVPHITQSASNVKKATKVKSKVASANKDNIYYVDVRSNGGSISVRQSDGMKIPILNSPDQNEVTQDSPSSLLQGISTTVGSPQIYIAAGQNSAGQSIVLPVSSQKLVSNNTSSFQQTDISSLKQILGNLNTGKSFIGLGSQAKPIILKSNTIVRDATQSPTTVVTQTGSQGINSNVKISTLPIISTLKPIVSIPAATVSVQRKSVSPAVTSSSAVPVHLIRNVNALPQSGTNIGRPQQTVSLMSPQQLGTVAQGSKTIVLQAQNPTASTPHQQQSNSLKFHLVTSGHFVSNTPTIVSQTQATSQSLGLVNPVLSTSTVLPNQKNINDDNASTTSRSINAQVVIDPVKGPYLKLPSDFSLPQNLNTTTPSSMQTILVHQPDMVVGQEVEDGRTCNSDTHQLHTVEDQAATVVQSPDVGISDFAEAEIYTVTQTNENVIDDVSTSVESKENIVEGPIIVKTESEYVDHDHSTTITLTEEEARGLVFEVQDEQSQVESSTSDICVEVQTEMGNQTCFISPEQLEQANHIIHVSQALGEGGISVKLDTDQNIITQKVDLEGGSEVEVPNQKPVQVKVEYQESEQIQMEHQELEQVQMEHGEPVQVKVEYQESEQVQMEHQQAEQVLVLSEKEATMKTDEEYMDAAGDSRNIDPRAPLAIREIPLFATSKSDSESIEDHGNE